MPQAPNDNDIAVHTMDNVLSRLERVRPTSRGWSACCPAHPDRTPSLSLAEGDTCVLMKCWAGCELNEIAAAMGIRVADLFYHPASGKRRTGRSVSKRRDWRKEAAALEDKALTLRLDADAVFPFACNLNTTAWTDEDWDAATDAVCGAYQKRERAEALEAEAFKLRYTNLTKGKAIGRTSRTVKRIG
ncbi:hypothetical protein [Nitrospira sp. Nam74]